MAYKRKTEIKFCSPVEYGLHIFGGKWDTRVLGMLHIHESMRYSELIDSLAGISNPILSNVLKKFQREDIIVRKHYDEIPPRVEYSLTEKGWELVRILQQVCFWCEKYYDRQTEYEFEYCRNCTLIEQQHQERKSVKETASNKISCKPEGQ